STVVAPTEAKPTPEAESNLTAQVVALLRELRPAILQVTTAPTKRLSPLGERWFAISFAALLLILIAILVLLAIVAGHVLSTNRTAIREQTPAIADARDGNVPKPSAEFDALRQELKDVQAKLGRLQH